MKTQERIKSVLLCVLLLGAVYLTYAVWFFDSPIGSISLKSIFNIPSGAGLASSGGDSDLEEYGIRPLAVLVRDDSGARGASYEASESDRIYKTLRNEIKSAVSSAAALEQVTEKVWLDEIVKNGVLLDWRGDVPFAVFSEWLGNGGLTSDALMRYMFISTDRKNAKIFIKSTDGKIFSAKTGLSSESLLNALNGVSGRDAYLAGERSERDFEAAEPEMICVDSRPRPQVISSYNSCDMFMQSVTDGCLYVLGLSDVTPSTYAEQNGTAVYVADMVTLKINPAGEASYSDTRDEIDDTIGLGVKNISNKNTGPTLGEKADYARSIASSAASFLPGSGGIYLASSKINGDNSEFVFCRHIGGIPIDSKDTGFFVRVVMRGKNVRTVRINLRCYDVGTQVADTMSERLAAAALFGKGAKGGLTLRYRDTGDALIMPAWFVSSDETAKE